MASPATADGGGDALHVATAAGAADRASSDAASGSAGAAGVGAGAGAGDEAVGVVLVPEGDAADDDDDDDDDDDIAEYADVTVGTVSGRNAGDGRDAATCFSRLCHCLTWLCCCGSLRGVVSKKKRRFVGGGVDLDLTYVTDRVVAMGYPSVGFEALYRNPADTVATFLDARHRFHYRIWNLCSEREYGAGSFNAEVERFAWPDHTPPPFAMVRRAASALMPCGAALTSPRSCTRRCCPHASLWTPG